MQRARSMPKMIIGWRERAALPGLGLDSVKVKVDTGAKTSALHATDIEPFTRDGEPWVRFTVHPEWDRKDLDVVCEARVADRRRVTNSGGRSERRYVILTPLVLAGLTWDIELTLTRRSTMRYPMLLGRRAMEGRLVVDPQLSHQCGGSRTANRTQKKTKEES